MRIAQSSMVKEWFGPVGIRPSGLIHTEVSQHRLSGIQFLRVENQKLEIKAQVVIPSSNSNQPCTGQQGLKIRGPTHKINKQLHRIGRISPA